MGISQTYAAVSCAEVYEERHNAPSGHYWLQSANGSAIRVFCDMTLTCKGVGGGWMQVAKLDMTNSSHQCPPGTRLRTDLSRRLCGIGQDDPGCSSSTFSVHGIPYDHVCGRIIGYQFATPDAFASFASNGVRNSSGIDGNYVDGISLTHGHPREHIWTFAGGLDEIASQPRLNCPCTNTYQAAAATQPPSFVGEDYFCDTGSTGVANHILYPDDPLWDGAGCGVNNTCCSLNNPPWFLKNLSSTTTDDIEMRMCRDQYLAPPANFIDEDTPIEIIEFYIR